MTENIASTKKYLPFWIFAYSAVLAITILAYRHFQNRPVKPTENQARIHEVSKALDLYYQDCKTFPTVAQGFEPLLKRPEIEPLCEKWDGPYLEREDLVDNKGQLFAYSRDEEFYVLEFATSNAAAAQ